MSAGPHRLAEAFFVLTPDGAGTARPLGPQFYADLERDFAGFKGCSLVSQHSWDAPWPTWEMHPHGDEFVLLLSGATDFVFWRDGLEEVIRVEQVGAYVVVPRGVWHTARPVTPTTMLFITTGEGTLNAEQPG